MTTAVGPRRELWVPILAAWALASGILVLVSLPAIARLAFPDPDDAMRYLEVRDWLAGQSWWDVAQHRLNRGDFPMHWSRLVDLPVASALAIGTMLVGEPIAARIALTLVPLVTLLCVLALAAELTRRVAGTAAARYAILLVPLSIPILMQIRPLRIDHHGWQIALALAAAVLLLDGTKRAGATAGAALGILLTISLEGLPIAAAIAGVAALGFVFRPERKGFLVALGWSLFGTALVLHVATRGPMALAPACDAMAPAWIAALGVAAIGVSVAAVCANLGVFARAAALGATGVAAAAALAAMAPECVAGPFATLPPIAYRLWYLQVLEGRPLWEQNLPWALVTIGLPLAGLIGGVRAWRRAEGAARDAWAGTLLLAIAALLVAVFVNRAAATANALALPGAAALLAGLLARARAIRPVLPRTLATAGALLAASPGQAAGALLLLADAAAPQGAAATTAHGWHRAACADITALRTIGRLPPGTVFAPIDATPDLIAATRHRGVAGGYHRGARPMAQVLRAFTGSSDAARTIVLASGADYVAVCPGVNEMELYRQVAPDGLWARLERGERFGWLEPLPVAGPALAWRVVTPLPEARARP